jgi:hypothetical protein
VQPAPVFGPQASDIGVKLFDAINATMASITGVSPNVQKVKETYNNVRQSLPAVHDIEGYLSSHQTSVAQLALQYCNVLVDDLGLRSQFFGGGVDFAGQLATANTSPVNDVGDMDLTPNGTAVVNALHGKGVGAVRTQPDAAAIETDVGNLIKTLCAPGLGGATCGGDRTEDVIKAACGATLGSAATVVQ